MTEIKNFQEINGGTKPYCDGQDAAGRFLSWIGGVWDDMVEGSAMTYEAMQHGR